jgi:uncharacterized protein YerC
VAASKIDQTLFIELFLATKNEEEMAILFEEVFSSAELERAIKRVATTKALLNNETYRSIEKKIGSSTYVTNRVKSNIVNSKTGIIKRLLTSLGELDG